MSTADDEDRYVYDPETASDRERAAHEAGQRRALQDAAEVVKSRFEHGRLTTDECELVETWLRDRAAGVGTKDGANDAESQEMAEDRKAHEWDLER